MGKKSRAKQERRLARMEPDPNTLLQEMLRLHEQSAGIPDQDSSLFDKCLETTRALLSRVCDLNNVKKNGYTSMVV